MNNPDPNDNDLFYRLDIQSYLAADPAPQQMLIPDVLPFESGMLVGEAGSGKTMLALTKAVAIAAGQSFMGKAHGEPRHVVFVAMEGSAHGIAQRVDRLVRAMDPAGDGSVQALVDQNLHILCPICGPSDGVYDMPAGIEKYVMALVEAGACPALVVLDTLASLTTGDENTVESTRALWGFANIITRTTEAAVLIIHHFGKPVFKPGSARSLLHNVRGSSAHVGSARFVLALVLKKKGRTESGDDGEGWSPDAHQGARGDVLELLMIKNNDGPTGYSMLLERDPETGLLSPYNPETLLADQEDSSPAKTNNQMKVLAIYTDPTLDDDARRERALQAFQGTKDPEGSLRSCLRHLKAKGLKF